MHFFFFRFTHPVMANCIAGHFQCQIAFKWDQTTLTVKLQATQDNRSANSFQVKARQLHFQTAHACFTNTHPIPQ